MKNKGDFNPNNKNYDFDMLINEYIEDLNIKKLRFSIPNTDITFDNLMKQINKYYANKVISIEFYLFLLELLTLKTSILDDSIYTNNSNGINKEKMKMYRDFIQLGSELCHDFFSKVILYNIYGYLCKVALKEPDKYRIVKNNDSRILLINSKLDKNRKDSGDLTYEEFSNLVKLDYSDIDKFKIVFDKRFNAFNFGNDSLDPESYQNAVERSRVLAGHKNNFIDAYCKENNLTLRNFNKEKIKNSIHVNYKRYSTGILAIIEQPKKNRFVKKIG